MREEVLRLDRVTYMEQGVTALSGLSLSIFVGEIMGLIPVNGMGLSALMRLLAHNVPIHYGYVYYREKLVNQWKQPAAGGNRISIIGSQSGLADDLTVADNIFVLRPGFGKHIIQREVLRRQLAPFLAEIGEDISSDAYVKDLSIFQRFVVELVKAVVAGSRLIVLSDVGTRVSELELSKLHAMLRHYADEGISFLYVSQHYEEIRGICGRAAIMNGGRITKVVDTAATPPHTIYSLGVDSYSRLVRTQGRRAPEEGPPVFEVTNLWAGRIAGLSLEVFAGECVVLQDLDNRIFDTLIGIASGGEKPDSGFIRVGGRPLGRGNRRDVAVIQQLAHSSMLFADMSYLDNLCFMMDHHLPAVWLRRGSRRSIRGEMAGWLGEDVFDMDLEELTQTQRYDLVYARVLLQRPKVVLCVQPFMQADVQQRMHIWKLLDRLLEKGIAVVILAVNLADTLSLADRLVRVGSGRVQQTFGRDAFGELPDSVPWHHLWR